MRYPSYDEWYENHYESIVQWYEDNDECIDGIDWLKEYESYISDLEDMAYGQWRDDRPMEGLE